MNPSVWSGFRRSHDGHRNNDVGNGVGWVIESFYTSSLSNGGISIRFWQAFLLNLADLLPTRLRNRRHRSEAHLYLAMLDSTFCYFIQGRHGLRFNSSSKYYITAKTAHCRIQGKVVLDRAGVSYTVSLHYVQCHNNPA